MQVKVQYTSASWPSLNNANIQLLGLFQDPENTSEPTVLSVHSRAMFIAAVLLSHQYNIKIDGENLEWQVVQTGGNRINALRGTCGAVSSSNIIGIVGPTFSREAHLIASFSGTTGIPTISHCATDPDLSDRNAYPAFHRTVSSDNAAAIAIGKLFLRYNWTSSIIMYQNDAFGSGGAKSIDQVFSNIGVIVRQTIIYDMATGSVHEDLKNLITSSSTRIIVLWADTIQTEIILKIALDNDLLGPEFEWILSSGISFNSFNQTFNDKLIGMLTVEPVIGGIVSAPVNITLLNAAYNLWQQYEPETFPGSTKIDYYALFAFDATWSLILSLQKQCSTSINSSSCTTITNASICFDRRFLNSNATLNAIDDLSFLGVSGPIQFSANTTDRMTGIYYVAQNSQSSSDGISFVPVLKYSDTNNWSEYNNTIEVKWPGNSLVPPSDRVVLEGVVLRIAVVESTPFTMVTYETDGNGEITPKFTGYVPDLIDLLRDTMKFVPQIILAPSNKTYTEVILDVANGVYDMMIGDVEITAARREIVSFSNTIFDNSLCIVMRRDPPDSIDLLSYLRPFTRNLWLLLLAAVVYSGVLVCILERQENEALKSRSIISLLFMGMWFAIGVIVGYGVDFHVRTAAGRLLTVGLYILSIVFVATYTANLASYLTISKSQVSVSSIDDIKNGKLTFNRIGIPISTSIEDFYLREISGGNRNFYPIKSLQDQFQTLIHEIIDATFMNSGIAEYVTNSLYCNLTIVGSDFNKGAFGIVMPKQWIYVQDIDIAILSLREKGAMSQLKTKWFEQKICPNVVEASSSMGIESLSGLFLTFAVVAILSVLLFMWTKRRDIKEYLLEVAHRKNLLTHIRTSIVRRASKVS